MYDVTVKITESRLKYLQERSEWLGFLEAAELKRQTEKEIDDLWPA